MLAFSLNHAASKDHICIITHFLRVRQQVSLVLLDEGRLPSPEGSAHGLPDVDILALLLGQCKKMLAALKSLVQLCVRDTMPDQSEEAVGCTCVADVVHDLATLRLGGGGRQERAHVHCGNGAVIALASHDGYGFACCAIKVGSARSQDLPMVE